MTAGELPLRLVGHQVRTATGDEVIGRVEGRPPEGLAGQG